MEDRLNTLIPSFTPGSRITECDPRTRRLEIPPGSASQYRLSQLDDYRDLPRKAFPWMPPVHMSLQARSSSKLIPGTWGFGFWNDPFNLDLRRERRGIRTPVLPNAAWFFFASPSNYLTLRKDLPPNGYSAGTFSTARWANALIYPGVLALPFVFLPPTACILRRLASRFLAQDSGSISVNPTDWHQYEIIFHRVQVEFRVDGEIGFVTHVSPQGRLGFLVWVDNRFLSLPPDGRFSFGTSKNPDPAWVEVRDLIIY